jgi:DNA modification methylase
VSAMWRILEGDARDRLKDLPAGSVQTVVTSPPLEPYFGLRDYGTGEWDGGDPACDHLGMARGSTASTLKPDGRPNPGQNDYERDVRVPYRDECGKCGARRVDRQIGLEPSPDEFVQALVGVFREVRRVLRDDGTVWLNLGDSYAANRTYQVPSTKGGPKHSPAQGFDGSAMSVPEGCKPKDLLGIPWLVAFALRADGWYLRSEIIWHKPNPMPESVTDRPTKSHEQVFLLSKGPKYWYDADAIREDGAGRLDFGDMNSLHDVRPGTRAPWKGGEKDEANGRNKRSVWTVATAPYPGAHFATFPPKLIEPCILAGSPEGGTVLDPFAGAGTTGMVALRHDRSFIGIELNPDYVRLARDRIIADSPLLNTHAEEAA